jgi:short-subunit dehydrogenase
MNCIITGASRGLGKAIAKKFAGGGYNLCLISRSEEAVKRAAREMSEEFPGIAVSRAAFDLGDKQEAMRCGQWVLERTKGQIDVLVNNAGQFIPGSIYDEADGTLEKMIEVNLYSAYHLTRALLPGMIQHKNGHIFNMCSIASLKAYANGGSYSISKFALAGFSKNLREELKAYNIKVTAVYPGAAFTDSWAASGIDPARIMEAGDIAQMVFAASSLSPQATVEDIILRPQLGDL